MATAEAPLLDPTFKKQIDRTLLRLHKLLGKLDQMTACGVECDEYRTVAQYLSGQLQTVNDVIFKDHKSG